MLLIITRLRNVILFSKGGVALLLEKSKLASECMLCGNNCQAEAVEANLIKQK